MKRQIRKSVAQQIVETVRDVSGHDINFINRDGIIFASTDPGRVGTYHEIGLQVIRSGQTLEVEADDSFFGTHRGVNLPVLYQGEVIAAVGITGVPDEVRKYAYLAQRITALILREQELDEQSTGESAQRGFIIRSLLLGETINYNFYMDFVKKYRIDPEGQFRAIVAEVNGGRAPANLSAVENSIYQTFDRTGGKLYTFSYPNEYILLLEVQRYQKWESAFRQLAREHPGVLKIGIGSPATLTSQDRSYQAAKIALASLMGEGNLAVFDTLDLEIILGTVPSGAKKRFLERTVNSLSPRDRDLLKAYFGCGMSLKAAGERLFMHKNTLQYQLDRIWRATGYNPRSFPDAVVLYLGLKLLM